jgi:tryptophan synthase alpha chain
VLEAATRIAERLPVVLMCYANLIFARGPERFARELAEAGVSGLIVPDLPMGEDGAVREACDAAGLALVPLVAPTTPPDRMADIASRARGFLYTVSVTGTTGERADVDRSLASVIERAKRDCPVPVCVGFGISSPEQASQAVDAGAEGVIVGSWLVRAAAEAENPAAAVGERVAALADALRR